MMKVTLEATSVLMKNARRRRRKKRLDHFTNATAHLGLINYGGAGPGGGVGLARRRGGTGEEGWDRA